MTDEEAAALAREHKGVWWDRRSRRFLAEMHSGGKKHRLGSFMDVEQAVAAYQEARAASPRRTRSHRADGEKTFRECYADFLAQAHLDDRGWPSPQQEMTYRGQRFVVMGSSFRRSQGRKSQPLVEWETWCPVCGTWTIVHSSLSVAGASGIGRKCDEHRAVRTKPAPRAKSIECAQPQAAPRTPEVEALERACQTLAMAHTEMDTLDFHHACAAIEPTIQTRWLAVLYKNPITGVELDREANVVRFTG